MLPVDPPFTLSAPDTPDSIVIASVTDPATPPDVIATRTVPPYPPATWHTTDVSDTHELLSHAEDMTRAPALYPDMLRPDPRTVIDWLPVPPTFTPTVPQTADELNDTPSVTLPADAPTVTAVLNVPDTPLVTRHATDVSDTHPLASHPVIPDRPPALYPAVPSPLPTTVTDTLPVLTPFDRRTPDAEEAS